MVGSEGKADFDAFGGDDGADGLLLVGKVADGSGASGNDGVEGGFDHGAIEIALSLADGGFHGLDHGEGGRDLGFAENEVGGLVEVAARVLPVFDGLFGLDFFFGVSEFGLGEVGLLLDEE